MVSWDLNVSLAAVRVWFGYFFWYCTLQALPNLSLYARHALGREPAAFAGIMMATANDSRDNAEREVERYMAWPGQALSYKIGQLKILEIRNKARDKLGPAFDIREFHDELLKDGSMPLIILEAKMDRWITGRTAIVMREAVEARLPQ